MGIILSHFYPVFLFFFAGNLQKTTFPSPKKDVFSRGFPEKERRGNFSRPKRDRAVGYGWKEETGARTQKPRRKAVCRRFTGFGLLCVGCAFWRGLPGGNKAQTFSLLFGVRCAWRRVPSARVQAVPACFVRFGCALRRGLPSAIVLRAPPCARKGHRPLTRVCAKLTFCLFLPVSFLGEGGRVTAYAVLSPCGERAQA